jgi:hypothetical protein
MIPEVKAALRTALAAAVIDGWPIRWPNDGWPVGVNVSDGDMPIDPDGRPVPAVEAEVLLGKPSATIGPKGARRAEQQGLLRIYLSVAAGSGEDAIDAQSDAVVEAFRRTTITADSATGTRLLTMDPRADDGVAGYREGNRFCRMVTVPFDYDFPD